MCFQSFYLKCYLAIYSYLDLFHSFNPLSPTDAVRVVDPALSFCELSTEFAIESLGVRYQKTKITPYMATLVFTIVAVGLVVGVSYYRFVGIFRSFHLFRCVLASVLPMSKLCVHS